MPISTPESRQRKLAEFAKRNARRLWREQTKNMKALNHVHIYVRRDKATYKCDDPHCGHWKIRKDVKGKATVCSKCRTRETIMDAANMRRAFPVCDNCSQSRDAIAQRERIGMLEGLFK